MTSLIALTLLATLLSTCQLLFETGAIAVAIDGTSFAWPASLMPYKLVLSLQFLLLATQLRFIFELHTGKQIISAPKPLVGSIIFHASRFYLLLLVVKSLVFMVAVVKGPSLGDGLTRADIGAFDLLSSLLPILYKIAATGTLMIMGKKIAENPDSTPP